MDKKSKALVTLAAVFVVALVVSNLIAGKLFMVGGVVLPAAVFLFPIVYIIGDVIPEIYGIKVARKIIMLGFLVNLGAVAFYLLTVALPYPPGWAGQEAFETVLGTTPRILLASFAGYLLGANANAVIMVELKKLTGKKLLFIRTIASTIVGESLDSGVFIVIAFYGLMPSANLVNMVIAQATFKIVYEILATPLTYAAVGAIERLVGDVS